MGYYAKDGSYQYEEEDLERQVARVRQGNSFEQRQAAIAALEKYEEEQKRAAQAEREFESGVRQREYEYQKMKGQERNEQFNKLMAEQQKAKNLARYGTEFDLRNPQNLDDRRSIANYWRIQNGWSTLINYINGKSKKFDILWDKFSKATTEEERLEIVEKMEKMFPTHESAIRRVEQGRNR